MQEFETFTYLDVEKTGSTYVSYLLQKFCCEKELKYQKHERVGERFDPAKFYFISVRDPLEQYVSLYSHGCECKGAIFGRLHKKRLDDLYDSTWDGFRRWLNFVLQPDNARYLGRDYGGEESTPKLIGLQTFRYLDLAMLDPVETLRACRTRDDVREAYRSKNIVNHTVRNERLNADLEQLLTTKLSGSFSDLDGALRFLSDGQRLNTSDRIDRFEERASIRPRQRARLQDREWLLHELLGY